MALRRLRGIADTERRLRGELVHDLVAGTDDESALIRAEALDYDLRRPHRVVIVEGKGSARARDALLTAVRRPMRLAPAARLCEARGRHGATVPPGPPGWDPGCLVVLSAAAVQRRSGVGVA